MACMDREGSQGGSALAILNSQASWTDVLYLSISLIVFAASWSSAHSNVRWLVVELLKATTKGELISNTMRLVMSTADLQRLWLLIRM